MFLLRRLVKQGIPGCGQCASDIQTGDVCVGRPSVRGGAGKPMCGGMSRLGVACGVMALGTLLTAFVGGAWLYAREPVTLPNSDITTAVSFRIGLWRVCPTVRRPNATIHMPSPACSLVKYSGWEDVRHSDLGIWTPLEFTPSFVGRMRVSTLFEGASVVLLLLATIFALMGHCNGDHKTLIACGLYILGGLSLGSGLVVFATVLSETFVEATAGKRTLTIDNGPVVPVPVAQVAISPTFDYRYGWSFFAAVAAFVLAELAALLSITAYLRRFPTVEDMVREMVPGAERKLREHQRLSSEYLVRHSGPLPTPGKYHHHHHSHQHYQYDPIPSSGVCTVNNRASKSDLQISELEACDGGPLLSKTPPDVCTTVEKVDSLHVTSSVVIPGLLADQDLTTPLSQTFAGQTIPITIKNHGSTKFSYTAAALSGGTGHKYGTLPHHFGGGTAMQQGFLGISEIGSSSSTAHHQQQHHHGRSMTLQHPRTTASKKSVTIGTFQTMDTSYPSSGGDPMKRVAALHGYPGSAV